MPLQALNWIKCEGNVWCPFLTVNLQHQHFRGLAGVYIIWHSGQTPWTVYVGQGDIADRLLRHRSDPEILQYSSLGLFVTWASVVSSLRDGIERYLADQLRPKVGAAHPNAPPIPVNLPWPG
jgi:hypothetical protein